MPLKRPFVPKSDVKQRFTTTTTFHLQSHTCYNRHMEISKEIRSHVTEISTRIKYARNIFAYYIRHRWEGEMHSSQVTIKLEPLGEGFMW